MAVVGVMRCPANHAANDSAEEVAFIREWAAATSWDSTRESLLAEGHCPACPGTERLQPGRQFWSAGSTTAGAAHAAPRYGSPTTSTAAPASTPDGSSKH